MSSYSYILSIFITERSLTGFIYPLSFTDSEHFKSISRHWFYLALDHRSELFIFPDLVHFFFLLLQVPDLSAAYLALTPQELEYSAALEESGFHFASYHIAILFGAEQF